MVLFAFLAAIRTLTIPSGCSRWYHQFSSYPQQNRYPCKAKTVDYLKLFALNLLYVNLVIYRFTLNITVSLQRQRRRQRHKIIGLIKKNNHCARAFMFLYISLPSPAKQREMTKFKVLWRTWAHDGEFFIFLPYLNAISINLVPTYFTHNVHVERIGIIAK